MKSSLTITCALKTYQEGVARTMVAQQVADINVLTATAKDLRKRLGNGTVTTVKLVELYMHQIDSHNHKGLH